MPMLNLQCENGHTDEQYLHTWQDLGCATRICACGAACAPALSVGRGLTYFEEGRAQYIEALGATVTSHEQHKRLMKAQGVDFATDWHTSRKGLGWAKQPPKDTGLIPIPEGI